MKNRIIVVIILSYFLSKPIFGQSIFDSKYIFFGHAFDGYSNDQRLTQINITQYDEGNSGLSKSGQRFYPYRKPIKYSSKYGIGKYLRPSYIAWANSNSGKSEIRNITFIFGTLSSETKKFSFSMGRKSNYLLMLKNQIMIIFNHRLILLLILFGFFLQAKSQETKKYIFFGHCYDGYSFDYRLRQIHLKNYDGIFLGGDILSEGALDRYYLEGLDSLVDLSNPMTMWTLGNHDSRNGNWDWISDYTKRRTFFVHSQDQSVFIVLNTNLVPYDCEDLERQFQIISNVCDSISVSKNLFVIMHHVIWDGVPGIAPGWTVGHENCKYYMANCDSTQSHFYNVIYPLLSDVQSKGINVFCLAGDMGVPGKKTYDETAPTGVHFLGCGLYFYDPNDQVLIFQNNDGNIQYEFQNLDSLVLVNSVNGKQ